MPELEFYYCKEHGNGGLSLRKCPMCEQTNNQFIIDAVKGEPNSLTSIAYHTGLIVERERIIKLLNIRVDARTAEYLSAQIRNVNEE